MSSQSPTSSTLRSVLRLLVGLAVSALFIWLVLRDVDLSRVAESLRDIAITPLIAALLVVILLFAFKAFRWRYQLATIGQFSLRSCGRAIVIGFFVNNALPLRAGDLYRAHLLARSEPITTATSLSTVALERVFDLFSLVLITSLVAMAIDVPLWMRDGAIIVGLVSLAGAAALIASSRLRAPMLVAVRRMVALLPERFRDATVRALRQIDAGLETSRGRYRFTALTAFAVSEWILGGLLAYASLASLGIWLPFAEVMTVVIATNLAMVLPAAPGNVGVFEFAVMKVLEFYGVEPSLALGAAVVVHAVFVLPASLFGLGLWVGSWAKPKEISE